MIHINGIRLSREMIQAFQTCLTASTGGNSLLYKKISHDRINMICAGLHSNPGQFLFSCCLDKKHLDPAEDMVLTDPEGPDLQLITDKTGMVSVYPHHSDIRILGSLLGLFGKGDIRFQHMVSSNAMISFVVETRDQESIVSLIKKGFSLPDSHTPFRQDIDEDISCFLKQYPETRASYVEEKIKTYGISLTPNLDFFHICLAPENLEPCGQALVMDKTDDLRLVFCSAIKHPRTNGYDLMFVTSGAGPGFKDKLVLKLERLSDHRAQSFLHCDFISFHGPHFGDRYRILDTALSCLHKQEVPILAAGCTGASIGLVLPAGQGRPGCCALELGFEAP